MRNQTKKKFNARYARKFAGLTQSDATLQRIQTAKLVILQGNFMSLIKDFQIMKKLKGQLKRSCGERKTSLNQPSKWIQG